MENLKFKTFCESIYGSDTLSKVAELEAAGAWFNLKNSCCWEVHFKISYYHTISSTNSMESLLKNPWGTSSNRSNVNSIIFWIESLYLRYIKGVLLEKGKVKPYSIYLNQTKVIGQKIIVSCFKDVYTCIAIGPAMKVAARVDMSNFKMDFVIEYSTSFIGDKLPAFKSLWEKQGMMLYDSQPIARLIVSFEGVDISLNRIVWSFLSSLGVEFTDTCKLSDSLSILLEP